MKRLERLHAITEEIRFRSPRPVSAARLAGQLGVTRRTIERDLASLRESGLPLLADTGRSGGQRLHPSAVLPPLNLTDRETTALIVALTIADGMPYTDAGKTAASKLRRLLPDATAVATQDLCNRIRIRQPALTGISNRTMHIVEDAVASASVMRIIYEDRHGTRTRRSIEPAGFLGDPEGWYLAAWCRLRQDRRLFRLDRIRSAAATNERAVGRNLDEVLGWLPTATVVPG